MNQLPAPNNLVVLTADRNCQFAVRGLLARRRSLGIKTLSVDFFVHPEKDPGVLRKGHEFLRSFTRKYQYAVVILDLEGCGRANATREELEAESEDALGRNGWDDRARTVVIDPELDVWVWSDSPHVATELGWADRTQPLRDWLEQNRWLAAGGLKPLRPKEALEAALREVRKPRSSALYQSLAAKVSLARCTDPAFIKLKKLLQTWFGDT